MKVFFIAGCISQNIAKFNVPAISMKNLWYLADCQQSLTEDQDHIAKRIFCPGWIFFIENFLVQKFISTAFPQFRYDLGLYLLLRLTVLQRLFQQIARVDSFHINIFNDFFVEFYFVLQARSSFYRYLFLHSSIKKPHFENSLSF